MAGHCVFDCRLGNPSSQLFKPVMSRWLFHVCEIRDQSKQLSICKIDPWAYFFGDGMAGGPYSKAKRPPYWRTLVRRRSTCTPARYDAPWRIITKESDARSPTPRFRYPFQAGPVLPFHTDASVAASVGAPFFNRHIPTLHSSNRRHNHTLLYEHTSSLFFSSSSSFSSASVLTLLLFPFSLPPFCLSFINLKVVSCPYY